MNVKLSMTPRVNEGPATDKAENAIHRMLLRRPHVLQSRESTTLAGKLSGLSSPAF